MNILIFGLVNSVILALMACGFALVYGVSRLANFAHGALYILVGFATWLFLNRLGINYIGSIFLSIVIESIIGGAIYRLLLIRVKGMPASEIIASLAIGIAIMELFRWRGSISEAYMLRPFIAGSVSIAGVMIDWQRLIIIGVGLAMMLFLWVFTHHTKVGLSLRAIAQDKHASMMSQELGGWQGNQLARLRELILTAVPELVEEWKWETPVWSLKGNVLAINTRGTLILGGKRCIATIGLDDCLVIETEDAILITKKGEAQKVKNIVNELKENAKTEAEEHVTTYRPWGSYTILEKGSRYKIKRIVVNPEEKLSLQMHYHRSEHWGVVKGSAKVTIGSKQMFVHENESAYVPKSPLHRLENPGKVPLEIIEVQNGEYVGEDDIVRYEDLYNRT